MADRSKLNKALYDWVVAHGMNIIWEPGGSGSGPVSDEQITDLATRLERAQWRRVEDGLPESETDVLVWDSHDDERRVAHHDKKWGWYVQGLEDWGRIEDGRVTHWRPLAEGPNATK